MHCRTSICSTSRDMASDRRKLSSWRITRGAWPVDIPSVYRRAYGLREIRHWLALFLQRFFANQFKRSALPNGPKMSSGGSLSPRGDWRAPADAGAAVWLAELAE